MTIRINMFQKDIVLLWEKAMETTKDSTSNYDK